MIVDTPEKYDIAIDDLVGHHELVVDVETNGLEPYGMNQICGVGVSPSDSETSYYFPVRHQQGTNLDPLCYENLIEFLNWSPKTFIGYNIKFDLHFLMQDGLNIKDHSLFDVLVMVRLTEPSTINDLDLTSTLKRTYGEHDAAHDIETK